MSEKLYAAHVNYGYQMLEQGDEAGAKLQFEQALAINANGEAAMAGLQALADPVATAQPMRYQVQQGDTLFSIARRFGVSVDVLRAANGLTDNTIATGQELLIP
ncbi:MAG: LysM peptidoglycan-binding domain-containing protein [Chloroflexi bacterium]|nr:MAG: LysM peptidoglycan-binding domain-containing protein [Chloroflexota bacterium]